MRVTRTVILSVAITVGLLAAEASAQRQPAPEVIARETPPPVFRSRSARSRLQTVVAIGGVAIQPGQLMTPFSLTPRHPFIDGRGALSSTGANTWTTMGATGSIFLDHPSSIATLDLVGPARRYLIDCAVTQGTTIRANSGGWQAQATAAASSGAQIVSFYTPPLPANPEITLTDGAPEIISYQESVNPRTGARTPGGEIYGGWFLTGCEITPVASP